jgi:hypothetical protein
MSAIAPIAARRLVFVEMALLGHAHLPHRGSVKDQPK